MALNLNVNVQIDRINNIFSNGKLNQSDCAEIINQLGQLSEKSGGRANFPMLTLYRDWSLHAQLDRNPIRLKLIQIENQFDIPENVQSTSDLVAELFSIKKFQVEVLSFTTQVPTLVCFNDLDKWKAFVGCFLHNVLDKPLLQTDRNSRIENMYLKMIPSERDGNSTCCWVIQLSNNPNVKIQIPFVLDY
jgi:hypothetical protein